MKGTVNLSAQGNFLPKSADVGRVMSHGFGYSAAMVEHGGTSTWNVLEESRLDGYRQRRIDAGFGERWYCGCPEFTDARPLEARASCRHTNELGMAYKVKR